MDNTVVVVAAAVAAAFVVAVDSIALADTVVLLLVVVADSSDNCYHKGGKDNDDGNSIGGMDRGCGSSNNLVPDIVFLVLFLDPCCDTGHIVVGSNSNNCIDEGKIDVFAYSDMETLSNDLGCN